jgi:hypothetical protein
MLRRLKRPQGARDLPGGGGEVNELRAATGTVSQTIEREQRESGDWRGVRGAYRNVVKVPCSCASSNRGATTTHSP